MNRTTDTWSVLSLSRDTALQQIAAALRPWPSRSIVEEYERRRRAKDLFDSTEQLVVALEFSLDHLKRVEKNCGYDDLIGEIESTVRQIRCEIRAISPVPAAEPTFAFKPVCFK